MHLKGKKLRSSKAKQTKKCFAADSKLYDTAKSWSSYVVDSSSESASSKRSVETRTNSYRSVGRAAEVSQLDSAYMSEEGKPKLKQKQILHSDSFDSHCIELLDCTTTPRSIADSTTSSTHCGKDNDSVKVLVRIRPENEREIKERNQPSVYKTSDASLQLLTQEGCKNFAFDAVIGDNVSQEALFQTYVSTIVERCLSGYNGCIFAYGQTGSGKTYTMLGDAQLNDSRLSDSAGIIPRIFKYLFELIQERRQSEPACQLEFECKCSFLEIYNETITDLLDSTKNHLMIREDKNGTHAANLSERVITSVQEAVCLIQTGSRNRSVAHTQMNAESSRSHSVLTCTVTIRRQNENGCSSVFKSRLNLVDLAGSERQKATGTTGSRLKEASGINKSLSTLGLVIMSLAESKPGKSKHVPYRDSKLTFLLQDSLGGNANAIMISNVSPSTKNVHETLSTLRFATGAKRVKNKVVANHDFVGSVSSLKTEIALLKQELKILKEQKSVKEEELPPETHEDEAVETSEQILQQEQDLDVSLSPPPSIKPMGLDETLASALQREDAAHRTVIALSEEIILLNSALEVREQEIRKYQLIAKFKDDKIQRLENQLNKQSSESWPQETEISRLQQEVDFFKEKANKAPNATRYAIENMQLKHELATLKWSLDLPKSKAAFDEQIMGLRRKLLEVNEEIKRYKGLDIDGLKAKADEAALEVVKEQSDKLGNLLIASKEKKQRRDELISRYVNGFTHWAKTVVQAIARPILSLKCSIKRHHKKSKSSSSSA